MASLVLYYTTSRWTLKARLTNLTQSQHRKGYKIIKGKKCQDVQPQVSVESIPSFSQPFSSVAALSENNSFCLTRVWQKFHLSGIARQYFKFLLPLDSYKLPLGYWPLPGILFISSCPDLCCLVCPNSTWARWQILSMPLALLLFLFWWLTSVQILSQRRQLNLTA